MGSIIEEPDADLHVPAVCDVEVAAALESMLRAGDLRADRASATATLYLDMPIRRHGHAQLLRRMLDLQERFGAFNAPYLALCERLGAMLITGNSALTQAVRQHLAINVIGVVT